MKVNIIGAGVAGLTLATELIERGVNVHIYERSRYVGEQACSWFAGGMLAPWCERESAEPAVLHYGKTALTWWEKHLTGTNAAVVSKGTMVFAQVRDRQELSRFSRRTERFEWIDNEAISTLEPDFSGRFKQALYFPDEAHVNPRLALVALFELLTKKGAHFHFNQSVEPSEFGGETVVDCRGLLAKPEWSDIRGVKGEMLIIRTEEITLNRPVRLLHPRIPFYIIPREDHHFMVGATMIENAQRARFSARSMLELLSSAYALHPSFAEAEIVEMGVDARPAFADNLPRLQKDGNIWRVNGLYRHGFLLSPSMAIKAADAILNQDDKVEQMNEYLS
ncbi:glycine oxidase ThiO [Marinomonas algarum]|uniref:D-amino-acid oxidase n=1 Tax=Marinomonas algarum TaxID=2883105 RepID=A0A9X1IMQ0_9GAMM|nr:glycine oxidase ThiO [Marinomonas algarum]MCB5160876.1 glycine oxidase ThiO [Marinomonas algarum]